MPPNNPIVSNYATPPPTTPTPESPPNFAVLIVVILSIVVCASLISAGIFCFKEHISKAIQKRKDKKAAKKAGLQLKEIRKYNNPHSATNVSSTSRRTRNVVKFLRLLSKDGGSTNPENITQKTDVLKPDQRKNSFFKMIANATSKSQSKKYKSVKRSKKRDRSQPKTPDGIEETPILKSKQDGSKKSKQPITDSENKQKDKVKAKSGKSSNSKSFIKSSG